MWVSVDNSAYRDCFVKSYNPIYCCALYCCVTGLTFEDIFYGKETFIYYSVEGVGSVGDAVYRRVQNLSRHKINF